MCVSEKLNFKTSRGNMPPEPPSVLAPPVLDPPSAGSTLKNFYRSCSDPKNGKEFDFSKNVNLLYVILV